MIHKTRILSLLFLLGLNAIQATQNNMNCSSSLKEERGLAIDVGNKKKNEDLREYIQGIKKHQEKIEPLQEAEVCQIFHDTCCEYKEVTGKNRFSIKPADSTSESQEKENDELRKEMNELRKEMTGLRKEMNEIQKTDDEQYGHLWYTEHELLARKNERERRGEEVFRTQIVVLQKKGPESVILNEAIEVMQDETQKTHCENMLISEEKKREEFYCDQEKEDLMREKRRCLVRRGSLWSYPATALTGWEAFLYSMISFRVSRVIHQWSNHRRILSRQADQREERNHRNKGALSLSPSVKWCIVALVVPVIYNNFDKVSFPGKWKFFAWPLT